MIIWVVVRFEAGFRFLWPTRSGVRLVQGDQEMVCGSHAFVQY